MRGEERRDRGEVVATPVASVYMFCKCNGDSRVCVCVIEITTVTMMPFPLFSNNVCFLLEFVVFQGCIQSCVRRSSYFQSSKVAGMSSLLSVNERFSKVVY